MKLFSLAAVIPSHNGMPFVLDAVRSAMDQALPPDEIIVIDDGSTDGVGPAIEEAFGQVVRVLEGRFGSAAAARNAGWRAARSTWIGFLDADDLWFPDKIRSVAEALEGRPAAGWFFSDGAFRTLGGELHASWLQTYADLTEPYLGQPVAELLEVNFILTSSVVVRRDVLEAVGGFDERLSHAEDLDLWIRLARRWPATASRRALVRYQHREGGLTRQTEARLNGDVMLFERLGGDTTLDPDLRARAARRARMAHYKLAISALREGRHRAARGHLRGAWSRNRAWAVIGAWGLSWLPARVVRLLRRQTWFTRGLGVKVLRLRRVALETSPDTFASLSMRKPS
jgi:glycosyltransferase involved in cell wall biosynthesis